MRGMRYSRGRSATVDNAEDKRAGSVASGDAARRQDAEADSTQPDSDRDRPDRDRAAAGRPATDRRLRRLALVRRAGLPIGVHHRAGDPADRVRGGRAAGRRHRVRRPGPGVPHPAGVRPEQRQRSGGALSHRGDVAAAGDRYRRPGGDRPARRHCRADLLGAYSAVPARRRLRHPRPAIRQGPRFLRLRPAVLPAGAQLLVRGAVPGFRRESVGALRLWRHPAVRTHRCAEPLGAHPAGQPGRNAGAAQGGRVLAGPLRAAVPHPRRQAVHRGRLHRYQRRAAGQADPAGDRVDLRGGGVLGDRVAGLAHSGDRSGAAAAVVDDRRCRLAADRRADQRQTQCGAEGTRIHQPKHHRDPASLRPDR